MRLAWMALSWLILWGAYVGELFAAAPEFRFARAEFVVSGADSPPHSGWQPQTLPDSWRHNHPGLRGVAWYRMRFTLDAVPTDVMALYVGRVAYTGQLWMNDLVLNPGVRFMAPNGEMGDDTGRWPQLIPIPLGLLRVGENVVHVRVQEPGPAGGRGLWDVRVGRLEDLRAPWLVREIPQRTLPMALFVLMTAGTVFGCFVWWRDRRIRNLHFTVVMALWTAIVGLWIAPRFPITPSMASLILTTVYIVFYWALLSLFYRYSESDWHWYPRVLHVVFALTLASSLVVIVLTFDSQSTPVWLGLLLSITIVMRILATVMLLQAAWRSRSVRAFALAAAELVWFAGQVQLIAIVAGWAHPVPFRLDPACSLPLFVVLLYLFVDELIRERDVAIREREAAITTERARILQDMHDGIGAQLTTALRIAQREDVDRNMVARSIEEALQDMRLVIDSLDAAAHGLAATLANLRYRLEPRLAALGIRLDWQVPGHAAIAKLTPASVLGVLRILQEAINNAVKHAQPSAITVALMRDGGSTLVAVSDDGVGFDVEGAHSGRGLSGMHRRAEALGGVLQVVPRDGGGTCVMLRLPAVLEAPSGVGRAMASAS